MNEENVFYGYAGFWKRFIAILIDSIMINIILLIITSSDMAHYPYLNLVVNWLYFALLESSAKQATVGKMALGIKVTDLHGERLNFARATGRYFSKIISGLTFGIGFLMAGFTEKKQALHDMIARTLVVNNE
jgi:uncharacterized RDD family membrane protein YckC